jgi:hypothetical protein
MNTRYAFSSILVGSMVLVCGQAAMAQQSPGAPGAPAQRGERPDERPAAARQAENYDPIGVPVGSFRLFPELELDEAYNDNVFATPAGTPGQTASFAQLIKPSLRLASDWNRHMLNIFATGSFGIFTATSLPNFNDWAVGTDGRLDIQRDWNVYGGFSFNHRHEDPGTPNAAVGANPPNLYDQITANVGYYQAFNRLNVRLDGRMDNYNYLNAGPGANGGQVNNFQRNRTEWREALRVGYEFSPGYQVWTRGSLNQRNYNTVPDASGFNRNNSGYDVVGGFAIDLGGITSVEVFGGYMQQNYQDFRFNTVSQPTFGLTGYWNPIRELWIKPFVQRSVNDASLANAAAYLNTSAGLDVEYKARPNIKVTAHGDYSVADYGVVNSQTNEYDQYLTLRGGVYYQPDNHFFIGPSYQFVTKTSNLINNNYNQSIVMLRLGAHL